MLLYILIILIFIRILNIHVWYTTIKGGGHYNACIYNYIRDSLWRRKVVGHVQYQRAG